MGDKKMRVDISRFNLLCRCGKKHEISVKNIIIEEKATKHLKEIVDEYEKPVILCDRNTMEACEESMREYFENYLVLELVGSDIHADDKQVAWVQERLPFDADVLIAVGSGTIHDITRYMAQERGIPFLSIPTAASVDGFVSTVAAMTWHGMKKTIPAVAPIYVLADTDIFALAPYRLTASGISDLMGKYTALLDWKISHYVTKEYFCPQIYELELEALSEVEAVLDKIRLQDKDSMEKLMYALILSGLAMQMLGNSRPASGAEHHVAHFWEMEVLNEKLDALHGEKVSIGLLLCLEHYERLKQAIQNGQCEVNNRGGYETEILKETFGKKGLYEAVLEENGENILETIQPEVLKEALPLIGEALQELPEANYMREKLILAGCVTDMKEIGLEDSLKELTLQLCPYVRRRLTLLRISKMFDYPKISTN
jgi:glycerol-1-phosphate dehydrogenase [NAD(P)+]